MLALDIARGVALASTALAVGAIVFTSAIWLPALKRLRVAAASGDDGPGLASQAFSARVAAIVLAAAGIGVAGSAGVLLLADNPPSRESAVWAIAAAAWLALASVAFADRAGALTDRRSSALIVALGCAGVLTLVPGLAGNAAREGPAALLVPSNAVHMLAASVWTGGIACLLLGVRPALAVLPSSAQTVVLVAVVTAFSALALLAVVALALTGVVQAVVLVGRIDALVTTGYGRLVMVKGGLLCLLALAGVAHRARTIPDLRVAAASGLPPAAAAAGLRRLLTGEAVLLTLVFAVTAALAGSVPMAGDDRPVSVDGRLGGLDVRLTASPGSPGANTLRVRLSDRVGASSEVPVRLSASARQRRLGIGPLPLRADRVTAGRFVIEDAALSTPGTWEITLRTPAGARTVLRLRLR